MIETCELSPATWIAEDGSVQAERRRPGRVDVHPSLIPLLRGNQVVDDVESDYLIRDDLGPAVGIFRCAFVLFLGWACVEYALFR